MKLSINQSFDINYLKGCIARTPKGREFIIRDVVIDISNHQIKIVFNDDHAIDFQTMKDWEIQFLGSQNLP